LAQALFWLILGSRMSTPFKMPLLRMTYLFMISLVTGVSADLRFASRAKDSYKLRNEGNNIQFANTNDVFYKYMEPSTFEYQGLAGNGQKRNNYDQFLRSNIDNEQDNRNFNDDDGEDHLPFRTKATSVLTQEAQVQLPMTMAPGEEKIIPLRWNNPHSAELEANLWIFSANIQPVVVPIKRPTCSGEGYQNNVIKFKIPQDVSALGGKIPGFTGCNADSLPMCTIQVYAHSVESRMYSYGFPIVISGPTQGQTTTSAQILPASADPRMDLTALRQLCMPSSDAAQHIANAVPQWANLFSDVYNHAYQNSDFSPYSGQQHTFISKNLQASAVNKMVTGNRGELGKNALPQATQDAINQLSNNENQVYKKYEALANNLINRYGNQMKETGTVTVGQTTQQLANVFRADTAGSTKTNRQQTNTYIPSFQLPANLVAQARELVPDKYASLIDAQGVVQIYVSAMNDLMPSFQAAAAEYGIVYQPNQVKTTLTTKRDTTQFKKRDAAGNTDGGYYAATAARTLLANEIAVKAQGSCPATCLDAAAPTTANGNKKPILKNSDGTKVTAECAGCAQLFTNAVPPAAVPPPTPISQDLIADPVAELPPTPNVEEVEDYPDEDGTPRVGRPPAPSTTTLKAYYSPGAWSNVGGGGGGVGVVGGSTRPVWDAGLFGFMLLAVLLRC